MYEFAWFAGGALLYQFLAKLFRITQLYLFFQELHVHILMMLQAASQDLENACEVKSSFLENSELSEDEKTTLKEVDKLAIVAWQENATRRICNQIPSAFKSIVQYNSWDGMNKYLNDIIKK